MRGHTLLELLFVLTLSAVTAAALAPTARRARASAAVLGAREAVVGLLADARAGALETGEAVVRVEFDRGIATLSIGGPSTRIVDLGRDFGVQVSHPGGTSTVDLRYGAMGLGRFTSQTLTFHRGGATSVLVVSSFGRVRRR